VKETSPRWIFYRAANPNQRCAILRREGHVKRFDEPDAGAAFRVFDCIHKCVHDRRSIPAGCERIGSLATTRWRETGPVVLDLDRKPNAVTRTTDLYEGARRIAVFDAVCERLTDRKLDIRKQIALEPSGRERHNRSPNFARMCPVVPETVRVHSHVA
jgi:hypothetical protein